ncbi:MAG: cbb3-type cytochrome oxidase assembly protein CcoS [Bacteroidota bacterium]
MSVIILLLIASISVASLFLLAFIWSVKTGQFRDDFSPAVRILFDDQPVRKNEPVSVKQAESK